MKDFLLRAFLPKMVKNKQKNIKTEKNPQKNTSNNNNNKTNKKVVPSKKDILLLQQIIEV